MQQEKSHKVEETTGNAIDMGRVLASKGVRAPRWVVRLLEKLLHVEEINATLYKLRDLEGVDFARAVVHELDIELVVEGEEHIPTQGYPIVAGNHPLGGPDGLALIGAVGGVRGDVQFPVNDFLMALAPMRRVFVPVDKVHGNRGTAAALEAAFGGENTLLYFPAGICSRRIKGKIEDLEWKPTVVKKAVQYHRDIVPVYFDARNRRRFYFLANLRKRLGIRFNFEMALLPGEMFAQRGKRFRLVIGRPIAWQTFDSRHTAAEWAAALRAYVYHLGQDPDAAFVVA